MKSIAAFRHRVTLRNPDGPPVPDGDGGFTQAFTTLADRLPAAVEPAPARTLERGVAGTVASSASHLVTVRYLEGVSTLTQAIFHDGRTDRLLSVTGAHDTEGRHVELALDCVEVVA